VLAVLGGVMLLLSRLGVRRRLPGDVVIRGKNVTFYFSHASAQIVVAATTGIAAATLAGSVIPAIPFAFGDSRACTAASIAVTFLAGAVIGHYRGIS
jgi:hypothetical protein